MKNKNKIIQKYKSKMNTNLVDVARADRLHKLADKDGAAVGGVVAVAAITLNNRYLFYSPLVSWKPKSIIE